MSIKSMLLRLQGVSGKDELIEKIVLSPGPASTLSDWTQGAPVINLVVGYNGSPKSHTALDLTLWIAYQTRLATRKQVTVQVVYVADTHQSSHCPDSFDLNTLANSNLFFQQPLGSTQELELNSGSLVTQQTLTSTLITSADPALLDTMFYPNPFEQADRILWQARCLADEWRGSLTTHLRFGSVSTELRSVAESEAAVALFLGCYSATHPIVQQLDRDFPCPVIGIPNPISSTATL